MGCGERLSLHEVIFLGFQSSISRKPVPKEGQLGGQQSQKDGQCSECLFHGAAGYGSAFKLIKVHYSIVGAAHGCELCGCNRNPRSLVPSGQEKRECLFV